jgi:hypothetical protein
MSEYTKLSMVCSDHLNFESHDDYQEERKILLVITFFIQLQRTYHTLLQEMKHACQFLLGRDKIQNIASKVDWDYFQTQNQETINAQISSEIIKALYMTTSCQRV